MQNRSNASIAAYAALADLLRAVDGPTGLFPDQHARLINAEEMPAIARQLLSHEQHMTVRLREFAGCALKLKVLKERQDAAAYSRQILLQRGDNDGLLEFGVVRIHLQYLPDAAVAEIRGHTRPLGDILIEHGIMRRIELRCFFRFGPQSEPGVHLGRHAAYGRLGLIHCDGQPAIEMLEVVPETFG